MKKGLDKLFFGLGAVTAATVTATVVSKKLTKALVGEALDRNAPKPIKTIADNKIDDFFSEDTFKSVVPLIEKLENQPTKLIEIEADDGTKLIGHYFSCDNPKRVVLAMHGWRSTWSKDFGASADFLRDNNCDVLYIEQRGQGNSGGEYMGFGMIERYDCLNWIDWLKQNSNELPIYLLGISMGAATVMMASGFDLQGKVSGIIADCGYTSANEIFRHVAKTTLHFPYSIKENQVNNFCKEKINFGTKDYSTIDALKTNKVPILFIHGTEDTFVPISMTYDNYKACVAPKKLFVVPGAKHGESYLVDKEGYEKTVLEFFSENDN
ncbi:MAG: alpha/beta hydrolase [Clostridia bacterium]|nr:alpha/beta hydrolase [Clostridia bacterium]